MWLACLLLLLAAYRIDCKDTECDPACVEGTCNKDEGVCECKTGFTGEDCSEIELTMKLLTAHVDIVNHVSETLKLRFEGVLQDGISTYKYILILLDITEDLKTTPFEKTLISSEAEQDASNKYTVITFPYVTENANTGISEEILGKKLELDLIIKKKLIVNTVVARGKINADLTAATIPGSDDVQYVEDADIPNGRWIKLPSTGGIIAGSNFLSKSDCEAAPCYIYENPPSAIPETDYFLCANVTADDKKKFYLCGDVPATMKSITTEGASPKQIVLDHTNQLAVKITSSEENKIDLVVHKSTEDPTACTKNMPSDITSAVTCSIEINPDTDEYKILLISYSNGKDDTGFKFTSYTSKNHELTGMFISSDLIEVSWDHQASGSLQQYLLTRTECNGEDDNAFQEVYVDCSAVEDCIAYFVDVPKKGTYQVTLQDMTSYTPNPVLNEVSIGSDLIDTGKSTWKKIIDMEIEDIQVKQEVTGKDAQFCFNYHSEITNKTVQNEIILINKKGNWKRSLLKAELETNQECCESMTFPLDQFDEAFELKMLVLRRDVNTGRVLASGEKTLQLSPDLRVIKPDEDNSNEAGSTSTLAIMGAAIAGVACVIALAAAAVLFVMKRRRNNDGLQYPLQRSTFENSNIIYGLDNLNSIN